LILEINNLFLSENSKVQFPKNYFSILVEYTETELPEYSEEDEFPRRDSFSFPTSIQQQPYLLRYPSLQFPSNFERRLTRAASMSGSMDDLPPPYVPEEASEKNNDLSALDDSWYFGNVDRSDADLSLQLCTQNAFLIRDSSIAGKKFTVYFIYYFRTLRTFQSVN
jgi:hypothetical protein